jgi:hypothetical protein
MKKLAARRDIAAVLGRSRFRYPKRASPKGRRLQKTSNWRSHLACE